MSVPENMFALEPKRKELDITVAEEIIVAGYPIGICQGQTNLPVIRQGIIATRLGEELHIEKRIIRGFLIDGGTIPGSSGSPVVLKPVMGRRRRNTFVMGTTPPVLLGIIAETIYSKVDAGRDDTYGFAGLGLAFDVETIVEVLNLF